MPQSRPKPSEIAAEAKRIWMPHIWKNYIRDSKTSYLYPDSSQIRINVDKRSSQRTRVAVMEGDPVNYALGWYQSAVNADPNCKRIPVINVANEKRAGGDWESGLMAPEECFARRSNLVHALTMPWNVQMGREENFYPIPQRGGIYSPEVCMLSHYLQTLSRTVYLTNRICSRIPSRPRSRLRNIHGHCLPPSNISCTSPAPKTRRERRQILVRARKRAHEGEDASRPTHRFLLRTQKPSARRLWPRTHLPQPRRRSSAHVEKASLRRRGVPRRFPGHRLCH
jgi:hypothetical protein